MRSEFAGGSPAPDAELIAWYPRQSQRYVEGDFLYWRRVGTGCDQVLATDLLVGIPGLDTVLTTDDLGFRYEPGLRLTLGWRPDPCQSHGWCSAWEVSYFGLFSSDASATAEGAFLALPGPLGLEFNPFPATEITAAYDWDLHNVELNCIKSCCYDCGTQIDFLTGFRFISLEEDFSLVGSRPGAGTGSYDVSTSNYLYGVQLGGRLRRALPRWTFEARGKAGVFVNDAKQRQSVVGPPDDTDVVRPLTGADGQAVAMLGEIGVSLIRPVTRNCSLRFGYDALGLGGLALAPDQLDFTDLEGISGTGLHKTGWLFLHGFHFGVEAYW